MHWSEPFISFLRAVVPEIADVPLYVLKTSESPIEWEAHWLALFSPLADLQAQPALESLGLWAGRGICICVRDDFETWSTRCQRGTLLHEAAHGLEHLSQPGALSDELSPVAREWLEAGEQKMLDDAGINRNDLIREQHGPDFVRMSMHLYWRSRSEMPLSPADVQFLHPIYSLGPEKYDDVVSSLAAELSMTKNLNLLRLRQAPQAFTRLFSRIDETADSG